jgi:hypothetical protein
MKEAVKPPSDGAEKPPEGPAKRKVYVTPKLIEYGSTSKLSAAKPGSVLDGSNSVHKTPSCL